MITMEHVCKSYRIAKRNAGFTEACKALFHREHEIIHALNDVSFTIHDGEMVGYIGPNGAGKSSTIKILSGILTPDSGTVLVDGRVPYKNRIDHVREIGVVFGQRSQLWWDVPVIDSFALLKDIYSISDICYRQSLEELTELLNLSELLRSPARQLSLGQRMRCEIAASLLHRPRILFLDEPTIGLDAVSKLAVRDFILRQNQTHKTTVILTTHDMQDIESLTSRILLIGKGQILLDGSLDDIRTGNKSIDATVAELYRTYNKGGMDTHEKISVLLSVTFRDGTAVPHCRTCRNYHAVCMGRHAGHDVPRFLPYRRCGLPDDPFRNSILYLAAAGVSCIFCRLDDGK